MSSEEIRRKSISLDCDTIFFSDVLGDFRSCPSDYGSSFYFEDEGNKVWLLRRAKREIACMFLPTIFQLKKEAELQSRD